MVATINTALDRKLLGLGPDDNWWPPSGELDRHGCPVHSTYVFPFEFNGEPAFGSLHDAGYGEVAVHGCVWPTRGGKFVGSFNGGFAAGEAFARAWLARREGPYLNLPALSCRRNRIAALAQMAVEPRGYIADTGRIRRSEW